MTRQIQAVLVTAVAALAVAAPGAHADVVIAEGALHDELGAPVAATVRAYAWRLDSSSSMPLLGSADTDATGHYRITVPTEISRYATQRRADVLLLADTPSGLALDAFTRIVPGAGASIATVEPPAALDLTAQTPVAGPGARAASGCRTMGKVTKRRLSSWPASTVVGEINNAYRDTTASFAYAQERHAESSISTAITPPLTGRVANVRWRLGTRVRVNNRGGRVVVTRRGPFAGRVLTRFQYARYRVSTCGLRGENHWYVVRPEMWRGGYSTRRQRGTLNVCPAGGTSDDYKGKGSFTTTNADAETFERGVDISSRIGFDLSLSTKSGFSENVELHMSFGPRRVHRLCGSDGLPAIRAPRVFSGAA